MKPIGAVPLTAAAEIDPVLPTLLEGNAGDESALGPDAARYPGTQVKQWLFRLEPAAG